MNPSADVSFYGIEAHPKPRSERCIVLLRPIPKSRKLTARYSSPPAFELCRVVLLLSLDGSIRWSCRLLLRLHVGSVKLTLLVCKAAELFGRDPSEPIILRIVTKVCSLDVE